MICLFAVGQAKACSIALRPDEKLEELHERGSFSAVAAVRIIDANYTHPPIADAHFWSASAKIDRVLMGAYEPKTVTFRRGGGSAACENDIPDGNALPKPGERWIVYIWTSEVRGELVSIAYPHAVALAADPVLKIRGKQRD